MYNIQMEKITELPATFEQAPKTFPVDVFSANNPGDDATIESLIDLYKNRKKSSDEFLKSRGLTSVTDFKEHLKKSGMIFVLAKSEEKVIGARIVNAGKSYGKSTDSHWLHSLWVDENFRRQGVSSALEMKTEDVLRTICKQTKKQIFMCCQIDEDNEKSHGSHKKNGWEKDKIFDYEDEAGDKKLAASWYKKITE